MNAAAVLILLGATGGVPGAAGSGFEAVPAVGAQAPTDESLLPIEESRALTSGVPVVNRFDDDGTYATWSIILRHENGRTTLAYESGGNRDLLRDAHAAVEAARLRGQAILIEGSEAPQDVILVDRITAGGRVFLTDQDDPLEDAAIEAEAFEAVPPREGFDALPLRIEDLRTRDGQMVKVSGVPVANVFKHRNGQGIWNVLISDGAATVLGYESGENIDQLSRLAALVDLALADKQQVTLIGRYDGGQQVLELSVLETAKGVRYLTDLGEAGATAGPAAATEPLVVRTVEPLSETWAPAPLHFAPEDYFGVEREYLSPLYVETPVPVVVEREVIIEHHYYWVFPEIVVVVESPWWRHPRPFWTRGWRPWGFCPSSYFDSRWERWHVRRHPAYFDFHAFFSWHREDGRHDDREAGRSRHDDGRRSPGDRPRGTEASRPPPHRASEPGRPGGSSSSPPPVRNRREDVVRRALDLAEAQRRAHEERGPAPRPPRREERPALTSAMPQPPREPPRTSPAHQPRGPAHLPDRETRLPRATPGSPPDSPATGPGGALDRRIDNAGTPPPGNPRPPAMVPLHPEDPRASREPPSARTSDEERARETADFYRQRLAEVLERRQETRRDIIRPEPIAPPQRAPFQTEEIGRLRLHTTTDFGDVTPSRPREMDRREVPPMRDTAPTPRTAPAPRAAAPSRQTETRLRDVQPRVAPPTRAADGASGRLPEIRLPRVSRPESPAPQKREAAPPPPRAPTASRTRPTESATVNRAPASIGPLRDRTEAPWSSPASPLRLPTLNLKSRIPSPARLQPDPRREDGPRAPSEERARPQVSDSGERSRSPRERK